MRRWIVALLTLLCAAGTARAQRIPGLPGVRPGVQPVRRDTTKDTTALVRWPAPDTLTQKLLDLKDYSITRYQGDTAIFNAQTNALDLLANKEKKLRAVVQRDSQTVVSDSGIFYRQGSNDVTTGGHYVLSDPSSGQADITGFAPQISFSLKQRSARITNAYLPVNNGEMWYMHVNTARVDIDTTAAKSSTAWIKGGSMTSCSDSIPDYQFVYKEAKRSGDNTIVARNVLMYVKDIPVAWFPFIFSDNRSGRHSGILPPQFGLGDVVRNSPTYRRNVDHVGYYWALSDYYDVATWLDWRSSAGGTNLSVDPGWLRYNVDFNYKWLDRFLGGRIGANYTTEADHRTNLGVSWSHSQDFSHDTHFTTSINYVTSTDLQRQNTFNPYTALATIASAATYSTKLGPTSLSLGATQKQYPGRKQVDRTFPTFSLTSTPVSVGKWLTWTPSFSFTENATLGMDQPGPGATKYEINALGKLDSTINTNRSSYDATTTFDTPLQIFGWDFRNSFRIHQQRNNFPEQYQIYDVNTGDVVATRVFAATYKTEVDWNPQFALPGVAQNRFNLTPSVGLSNVDPGPFWIASERTNGRYVHQAKRPTFGLSATPTLYGLFPGFGPFERIRHSITPSISYTYAPAADVGNDFLKAIGSTRKGYLGSLASNSVSIGLQQNFEAKVRPPSGGNDSATTTGSSDKIKLLSINFNPVTYDFERASVAKARGLSAWRGITTDSWGYSLNSDLLPGFDFSANYSLFQGSALSDSAVFKPWLQSISASLNIGRDKNPFTVLARLFGHPAPEPQKAPTPGVGVEGAKPAPDQAQAAALAAQPVAGSVRGGDRFIVPTTAGWTANFAFSRSSPRPPVGANVIDYDPRVRCQQISAGNPFLLDACLAQERAQPTTDTPVPPTTAGGPAYKIPPTTSLNANIAFNLTPKWSTHWTTTYDFEHHQFASHMVQLQRDLHDWRALFGFTQSPNGNFAFNFTIALKAEPDIKFDYNRATVRSGQSF